MFRSLKIVAALVAAGLPSFAAAQMVTAQNPQSIVDALTEGNYQAQLKKAESGVPYIDGMLKNTGAYLILFEGCKDNANCTRVQFFSPAGPNTSASLEKVNEWNSSKPFARAYVAKGTARLEMDLDLDDGGMSRALFIDNVEYWEALVTAFKSAMK